MNYQKYAAQVTSTLLNAVEASRIEQFTCWLVSKDICFDSIYRGTFVLRNPISQRATYSLTLATEKLVRLAETDEFGNPLEGAEVTIISGLTNIYREIDAWQLRYYNQC